MCGRNVSDKEISVEGLYKTGYALRVDRNNYKREQAKIDCIDKTKRNKIDTITAVKALRA